MNEIERVSAEIRKNGFDFLTALQTTKEIKVDAFERLDQASKELARLLKGSEQLPRQIVHDIYSTAMTLENEAPYAKDSALVKGMAAKVFFTFGLILLGESHDDRRPGVPRVR